MALTNAQLQARIVAIEEAVNTIQTGIANLADKKTLNAVLLLRQSEVAELQESLSSLTTQIELLQSELVPASHTHDASVLTGFGTSAILDLGTTEGTVATGNHDHDLVYSLSGHTHSYSPLGHNHDPDYSLTFHHHDPVYSKLTHDHEGTYAVSGHDHNEETASGLLLQSYTQAATYHTSVSGVLEINYAAGNVHKAICIEDVDTLTFAGIPASGISWSLTVAIQHPDGGSTWTWPGSIDWGDLGAPTLSATAGAVDIIDFNGEDGGVINRGSYLTGYSG